MNKAAKGSKDAATCRVHGCTQVARCAGLCVRHYRLARTGSADDPAVHQARQILEDADALQCNVPGCYAAAFERGLCAKHFARAFVDKRPDAGLRRYADAQEAPAQSRRDDMATSTRTKVCNVPGCGNKVIGRGLCGTHYGRLKGTDAAKRVEAKRYANEPTRRSPRKRAADKPARKAAGAKQPATAAQVPAPASPEAPNAAKLSSGMDLSMFAGILGLGFVPVSGGVVFANQSIGSCERLAYVTDAGNVHRIDLPA